MRFIVLNDPVGVQVPMEFNRIAVFIELAFRCIVFFSCFLDFVVADGAACRFNEPGINCDAFIDSKALLFKLAENL